MDKRVGTVTGIILILAALLATPLGSSGATFDLIHTVMVVLGVAVAVGGAYVVQAIHFAS